jgi:replicative DNA helicase
VSAFSGNKEELSENPKKAMGKILHDLNDIEVLYDEDVQEYDTGDLDRLEDWKERRDLRKLGEGLIGIKTPFKSINSTGVGWQPGDLISAFARPTVGKTWMCVDIAATATLNGYKTLLVSTEMTKKSIDMRMDVVMGNKSGYKLSHRALRTGSPIDEEKYADFLTEVNKKNLLICDHISGEDSISLHSIANLIRKHAPDITVIDGVYLISTASKNTASWEQNHSLFYGLKNLALSQDTTIVVSTQATRDASNMFAPPRADQVAFGDALIRASDVALSMCMVEDADNLRSVQFQKYRDGDLPADMCTFLWNVDEGEIKEVDDVF